MQGFNSIDWNNGITIRLI